MSQPNPALAEQQLLAAQFVAEKRERSRQMETARIEKAEDLARRSAELADIKRLKPLPENRGRLNAAARRAAEKLGLTAIAQLARAAHDVYTLIRTAVARQWAGLKASAQDMANMLGISKRTFWRAVGTLRKLKLVGSTPNYEASGAYTDIKTRKVYSQQQIENTYWIAHSAPQRDFKMCLEAEGRTRSRVSPSARKGASVPSKPQVLSLPPSDTKAHPLPDYVRKEGPFLAEGETLERVRPSAVFAELAFEPERMGEAPSGMERRADRATVAPVPALAASSGCASEADRGKGASSGPSFDVEKAAWIARMTESLA